LCTNGLYTEIKQTYTHFTTNYFIVVTTIGINQIYAEQSLTTRLRRLKKTLKEEILDNKNNTEDHWNLYNEQLMENFENSYATNPQCTTDFAYNKIADQLGKTARFTLR
jgi:hypothetical protein